MGLFGLYLISYNSKSRSILRNGGRSMMAAGYLLTTKVQGSGGEGSLLINVGILSVSVLNPGPMHCQLRHCVPYLKTIM